MKYEIRVEVRINKVGEYSSALNLGETVQCELNTLSDAAMVLVRLHELFNELLSKKTSEAK